MNYQRIYNEIIERAKERNPKELAGIYTEKHHTIPKCMGGSNDKDNIVLLTAREHFVCHWLLSNHYKSDIRNKLHIAFQLMANLRKSKKGYKITSRKYAIARDRSTAARRGVKLSLETRKKMSLSNIGRKHTKETRKKMSKAQKGKHITETGSKRMSRAKIRNSPALKLPAIVTTQQEENIKIDCLYTFCKENSLITGNALKVYRGLRKTVKGYGVFPVSKKNVTHPKGKCWKLTEKSVVEVRKLLNSGIVPEDIAKMFGVAKMTIQDVEDGRTWRHVLDEGSCREPRFSKLTKENVVVVKQRLANGDYYEDIANDYGVGKHCIHAIKHNKTWKHVKI